MAKVKYRTLAAGPNGVIQPGTIVDVSDEEAKQLVDGRYGELIESDQATTKKKGSKTGKGEGVDNGSTENNQSSGEGTSDSSGSESKSES